MRKYRVEGYDRDDNGTGVSAVVFATSVEEAWIWAFDHGISADGIMRLDASGVYEVEMRFDDRVSTGTVIADSDREAYGDAVDMAVYLGSPEPMSDCSDVRVRLIAAGPSAPKTDLYVTTAEGGSHALEA